MSKKIKESVRFLIESDLDRAEVVLAAQAMTDKLQDMAEDLAKIEANDLMPILDPIKEQFGPDVATRFNDISTQKLRDVIEILKSAKDSISTEIMRMEGSIDGDPLNDMSFDDTDTDNTDNTDNMTDMDDTETGELPDVDDTSGEPALDGEQSDDINDLLNDINDELDDNNNSAGRARKESIASGANALMESKNPDRLIYNTFCKNIGKGRSTIQIIESVSRYFGIDSRDVVQIVKEETENKKNEDGSNKQKLTYEDWISQVNKIAKTRYGVVPEKGEYGISMLKSYNHLMSPTEYVDWWNNFEDLDQL